MSPCLPFTFPLSVYTHIGDGYRGGDPEGILGKLAGIQESRFWQAEDHEKRQAGQPTGECNLFKKQTDKETNKQVIYISTKTRSRWGNREGK